MLNTNISIILNLLNYQLKLMKAIFVFKYQNYDFFSSQILISFAIQDLIVIYNFIFIPHNLIQHLNSGAKQNKWRMQNQQNQPVEQQHNNSVKRLNQQLSPQQLRICECAHAFVTKNSPEIQQVLKSTSWRVIFSIITHPNVQNNIRIVCCSTLKWLIYQKKFVDDPLQLFNSLCQFYLLNLNTKEDNLKGNIAGNSPHTATFVVNMQEFQPQKSQQLVEIVIKVIFSNYLKNRQKEDLVQNMIKNLQNDLFKSTRILKLLKLIIEELEVEKINNQAIVGEILIYMDKVIKHDNNEKTLALKLMAINESIGLIQHILDLIDQQDQIDSNVAQQFLQNSTLAKKILQQIILDGSNGIQIITTNKEINKCKYNALELYSSIWVYYLDDIMFKVCLNSLLTKPSSDLLVDESGDIMEKIIIMLERSIGQQAYYDSFHKRLQQITISLLILLKPKQSQIQMLQKQPEQFVQMLSDFCMQQQQQLLQTKVGSMISALCLYIDGYMSFLGSLCIMVMKQFNGTIKTILGAEDYMSKINLMWPCTLQEKIASCVLVLCSISDQMQKRQDLFKPLKLDIINMSSLFKYPDCRLPAYLICRFMFLYSFYAYPKCLDVFLPYKNTKPVYQHALQHCHSIMSRYYNRYPQCKRYIDQIGHITIVSDRLTPLLQTSIMTSQLTLSLQFEILEKLVLWIQDSIKSKNRIASNKYANLITILLDRMIVQNYSQVEEAVFKYLQPTFKFLLMPQGHDSQQFIIQIATAFIKRFPSLQKSKDKLMFFINVSFKTIEKNNGVLNLCLDLLFQITNYLPYQLLVALVQIYLGCLESQERQEDHWQCYYGLENCMIKICELKQKVPNINISSIYQKIAKYRAKVLVNKAYMFLYSMIIADIEQGSNQKYKQIFTQKLPKYVPIYENKAYCIYLMNIYTHIPTDLEYAHQYLLKILDLIREQKDIEAKIKQYEEDIHCSMQQHNEVVINAYTVTRRLIHPFLMKNIDIYNQFRKFWWKFPLREPLMKKMSRENLNYVTQLCTQRTVNQKVRKIFKIKQNFGSPNDGNPVNIQHNQSDMS